MKFTNCSSAGIVATVLLCLLTSATGRSQKGGAPQLSGTPDTTYSNNDPLKSKDETPFAKNAEEKQARLRNEERQKRLVSDTDRLLILATQLHDDVSKTDKNILSVDVVHRADEIERLAHSVKERMKAE